MASSLLQLIDPTARPHPHVVDAVRWSLTLLRYELAKHGLPGDRVAISECHGMLTGETPLAPLRGRTALALAEVDGATFGVRTLGDAVRAWLTIDVRGRMVFGATLDLLIAPHHAASVAPNRRPLAELLATALHDQEVRLVAAILR